MGRKTKLTTEEALKSLTPEEAIEVIKIQQKLLKRLATKDELKEALKKEGFSSISARKLLPIIEIPQST
jgi:hypothetical protein